MYFSRLIPAVVAIAVLAVGANAQCCPDPEGHPQCPGDGTGTCYPSPYEPLSEPCPC
ncbi:hypothetical protein NEOLEDRAFT_1239218 [Neolentinus lepideus HHB14362 ss-1]|uniref:CBM1 domain-containing protein n=1 Tax=Neolentinus lepideus HHB14362 ss-1 TaxID=1314782 RepID=A0A165UT25_9AGAM|nr:hypothetical protein NEOLEDRAFT_1239218 [Neolentinus lepideus HHB14362 ss-1]